MTDTHEAFSDTDLIAIHAETTFVISAAGRIQSESKPDLSGLPRFILAGCNSGNVFYVHRNVDDATVHFARNSTTGLIAVAWNISDQELSYRSAIGLSKYPSL